MVLAVASVVLYLIATSGQPAGSEVNKLILPLIFGSAIFGTFVELIRRLYDTAVKRLNTIDLFVSEMLSIARVLAAMNLVGHFIRLYDQFDDAEAKLTPSESPAKILAGSSAPTPTPGPTGFADTARKENYFSIFERNGADLAFLDPGLVNDVAAFYTFLKGSRDATMAMNRWSEPQYDVATKKDDVVAIIYLVFLMMVHGDRSLSRLLKSTGNESAAQDIIAGILLQCFCFVDHVMSENDYRRPRIEQRRMLCVVLTLRYGYDFGPAAPSVAKEA